MTTALENREAIVTEVARRIQHGLDEWEAGRMTSPDERDYVICARETLTEMYPAFIGTTPEGEEFVADELYEDAGENYVTVRGIAEHLVDVLTAE